MNTSTLRTTARYTGNVVMAIQTAILLIEGYKWLKDYFNNNSTNKTSDSAHRYYEPKSNREKKKQDNTDKLIPDGSQASEQVQQAIKQENDDVVFVGSFEPVDIREDEALSDQWSSFGFSALPNEGNASDDRPQQRRYEPSEASSDVTEEQIRDSYIDCFVCGRDMTRNTDEVVALPGCCHRFHERCIDTVVRLASKCPVCQNHIVSVL